MCETEEWVLKRLWLLKLNVKLFFVLFFFVFFFQWNQTLVMFAVCLRLDLAWV